MKTMKSLIVGLALFIGLVGSASLSHAGGRNGNGWTVTCVTGTAMTISSGKKVFLHRIDLSTAATDPTGQGAQPWLIALSSAPGVANGAGVSLMPHSLFMSTTAVTPPLVFVSSINANAGTPLNNSWSAGDSDDSYVEVPGQTTYGSDGAISRIGGGLHIRKSDAASGGANIATVYWSE